jgi:vitamin B12 transporter
VQTRRFPAAPVLGVALIALTFPCSTQAQQDTVRLGELVVTATRSETARRSVSASISSISGEELRERGIRFVIDWLREVPGVAVVQSGSFGGVTSLFLRGGESDYTKVLIDGVPANQPGGAFDLAHLSTENVERIEVLRGPGSVLYGSDAVSGVIQIFTRRGTGTVQSDLSARAGTFGTTDLRGEAAGSSGVLSWSAGLARFTSDGIYPYNNRYRSQTASLRLGLTPHQSADLALTARWGDHLARFPTDFAGVPSDTNQFTTERALTVSLEGGWRFTPSLEIRALGALFDSEQGFDDLRDTPADTNGFGYEGLREGDVRRRLLDLRALVRPMQRLTLSAGVERVDEREQLLNLTRSNFGDGSFTDETRFERDRGNTAVYSQALLALTGAMDLQAGLRYDDNQVFGGFTTWRVGAVARPTHRLRLHAAAGSAFRQPTFAEQFADTPFEVGNPDLSVERTLSWEAGAELKLADDRITLSGTWFAQRFRDLIQYRSAAPDEPTYANVARARADGVELGAGLSVTQELSLGTRYGWLDTEVQDAGGLDGIAYLEGEALLRRPAHTLGADLTWHPAEKGHYTLQWQRTGERTDVDFRSFPAERVALRAYSLVDLSAEVPLSLWLRSRRWAAPFRLTFAAQNLLDQDYEPVVGFRGRGRTLLVGGRVVFR